MLDASAAGVLNAVFAYLPDPVVESFRWLPHDDALTYVRIMWAVRENDIRLPPSLADALASRLLDAAEAARHQRSSASVLAANNLN